MNQSIYTRTTLIPVALSLVPLVLLLHQIRINYVDVPFWDQWQFTPILMKLNDHSLLFKDLFNAHNGHIIFFPRIVMLILAIFSDWNTTYEVVFIVLLAVSVLLAFTYIAMQSFDDIPRSVWLWVVPALAVLVFSLRQYENWLWGWQISVFLNLAAFSWGTALLANKTEPLALFFISVCLGYISTFSFANGLLFWLVAFPLLLQHRRNRKLKIGIWVAVSIVAFTAYFQEFKLLHSKSGAEDQLSYLLLASKFFVIVLGSLVVDAQQSHAVIATVVLVACMVYASVTVLKLTAARAITPLWTITLYSVGSAAMMAFARTGHGVDYAFQSRYTTLMLPLWSTLLIFLFYVFAKHLSDGSIGKNKHSIIALLLFGIIAMAGAKASLGDIQEFRTSSNERTLGRNELLRLPYQENEALFNKLCWSSDLVKTYGTWLKEQRLSLFRPAESVRPDGY